MYLLDLSITSSVCDIVGYLTAELDQCRNKCMFTANNAQKQETHGPYRSHEYQIKVAIAPRAMQSLIILLSRISNLNSNFQQQYEARCVLQTEMLTKVLILINELTYHNISYINSTWLFCTRSRVGTPTGEIHKFCYIPFCFYIQTKFSYTLSLKLELRRHF